MTCPVAARPNCGSRKRTASRRTDWSAGHTSTSTTNGGSARMRRAVHRPRTGGCVMYGREALRLLREKQANRGDRAQPSLLDQIPPDAPMDDATSDRLERRAVRGVRPMAGDRAHRPRGEAAGREARDPRRRDVRGRRVRRHEGVAGEGRRAMADVRGIEEGERAAARLRHAVRGARHPDGRAVVRRGRRRLARGEGTRWKGRSRGSISARFNR